MSAVERFKIKIGDVAHLLGFKITVFTTKTHRAEVQALSANGFPDCWYVEDMPGCAGLTLGALIPRVYRKSFDPWQSKRLIAVMLDGRGMIIDHMGIVKVTTYGCLIDDLYMAITEHDKRRRARRDEVLITDYLGNSSSQPIPLKFISRTQIVFTPGENTSDILRSGRFHDAFGEWSLDSSDVWVDCEDVDPINWMFRYGVVHDTPTEDIGPLRSSLSEFFPQSRFFIDQAELELVRGDKLCALAQNKHEVNVVGRQVGEAHATIRVFARRLQKEGELLGYRQYNLDGMLFQTHFGDIPFIPCEAIS